MHAHLVADAHGGNALPLYHDHRAVGQGSSQALDDAIGILDDAAPLLLEDGDLRPLCAQVRLSRQAQVHHGCGPAQQAGMYQPGSTGPALMDEIIVLEQQYSALDINSP